MTIGIDGLFRLAAAVSGLSPSLIQPIYNFTLKQLVQAYRLGTPNNSLVKINCCLLNNNGLVGSNVAILF